MADTNHKPNRHREQKLKRNYNLTESDYNRILARQKGKCGICENYRKLVVDHCHKTGKVRGLLCSNCNSGIGLLGENPTFIRAAAAYVARHT